ncbi:GGDEF domain-containing protein [Alteromonas pelagimontana]|uniref:diguanylate cyclase n=1 Tax=Alteromonas pelagimontana TaxID=1858656 RepID=A0A6M4MFD4_9ALTE|nr:GGDEF domain-containing protein [Alteromonas pelagimontana]QJR81370.1 GGDEF domain-containing protein [Alteromonas pelagimontana]
MRNLLLTSLFSILLSAPVCAGVVDEYQIERSRLLRLDYPARHDALLQSAVFDTTTALGKYFFNTVLSNTGEDGNLYILQDAEVAKLKQNFPQIYYEKAIFDSWHSNKSAAVKLEELAAYRAVAKENNWSRIERWATSATVSTQIDNGYYYTAVLTMQGVENPPHIVQMETMYDYPLIAIYLDMANAFYFAGDYHKSVVFCQRYKNYLPDNIDLRIEGDLCQVRSEIKLGQFDKSLKNTSKIISLARENNRIPSILAGLSFTAKVYLDKADYQQAKSYALEVIEYLNRTDHQFPGCLYTAYYLLAQATIALNQTDEARGAFQSMLAARGSFEKGARYEKQVLEVEAGLAELEGHQDKALAIFKKLVKLNETPDASIVAWKEFSAITKELDDQQLSFLKIKSGLDKAQSHNMTILALFTSVFAVVASISFWRLFMQKKKIESFSRLDNLTSVNNRWHACEMIRRRLNSMNRQNDSACVAIIDIDNFKKINELYGHDAGDKALIFIAKHIKYQLRQDDVFGRFGGEKFILMLDDAVLEEAEAKINDVRRYLASQEIDGLSATYSLGFCCGLVEITRRTDVMQVSQQCESLLKEAKKKGRNQNATAKLIDRGFLKSA